MDLSSLNKRLCAIEARLAQIETKLNLSIPQIREKTSSVLESTPNNNRQAQPTTWSGNLLGIIAIICFVLAGGFIIKLSIESGWLTPIRQIAISTLFGVSLITLGIKLLNFDRQYVSQLPAAGIIVLYLSAFAAHRLYALITFEIAMLVVSTISLLCIFLYLKMKHDIYPITATVGAYLAPILLGLGVNSYFSLYYFILCSLTFAIISIWVQSRILTIVSAYLAILATACVGFELNQNSLIACVLALHFVIFSLGIYLYSGRHQQALTEVESWSLFPVLLIFYGTEYYFISLIQPDLAAWISLVFAGFLIALYLAAKKIFILGAAHLIVILAFYRLTDAHGSLAVSTSWLSYATVVIVFSFIRKDKIMANSALLVLGFSAGKALLYDAASAPTIIRILCLLLTGVVFYGAGFLFRKIAQWRDSRIG